MPAGYHHYCRLGPDLAVALPGCCGRAFVIQIDITTGQRQHVARAGPAVQERAGLAQCCADIDVAIRLRVEASGLLDQFLDLVGAEHHGISQRVSAVLVGLGVRPGQFDQAVVTTVEVAAEQVFKVLAHGVGVGAVQAADVLRRHRTTLEALRRIFSVTTNCFSLSS